MTHARSAGLAANMRPTGSVFTAFAVLSGATAVAAVALSDRALRSRDRPQSAPLVRGGRASPVVTVDVAVRAACRLNRAAGTIAASVLLDSATEHYRGAFANKAMYTPIAVSTLSLLASFHGQRDRSPTAHRARDLAYALAGATGVVGTAFHLHNITRRPGGICWQNLFYAAPLGAPAAISLSGMVGFLAERVRDNRPGTVPLVAGLPAGRVVAALTGAGLMGTVAEAGLLHFRGAFRDDDDPDWLEGFVGCGAA